MLLTRLFFMTISTLLLCSCAKTSELIPGGAVPTPTISSAQKTPTPIILIPTPEPASDEIKIDITEQDQLLAQSVIKIHVESKNSSKLISYTGTITCLILDNTYTIKDQPRELWVQKI